MTTPPPDLFSSYLTTFKPYIDQYGYGAVFAGILLEDFGVPMPGETLLVVAAILASQGDLHLLPLLLAAWLGAVIGDNIGYAIGRFGGHRLLLRYGYYLGITEVRLARVHRFFEHYGGGVVVVARFIELLRQFNGIVAGSAEMQWWRFLAYNMLGAALWVGLWGTLPFFLGSHLETYLPLFKRFEGYLLIALLAVLLILIIYVLWRYIRRDGKISSQ